MTPRSFLAVSQNGQDLRGRDQCEPPLQTFAKTPTPTNLAQLLAKISCRHLNAYSNKNSEKWRIFKGKIWLQNHFWWLFGHVWTRFFILINFSSTLGTYWIFLGQKNWLIFHPLSTLISLSGWLPKAITAPWKCSLRVQWWNTFQLVPSPLCSLYLVLWLWIKRPITV